MRGSEVSNPPFQPELRAARSPIEQFASGAILVIFLTRFFYVTESAAEGDTLWIVAAWFLCFLFWLIGWWCSRNRAISIGWFDLSVAMLTGGHIISALFIIIATSGEKRPAINLAWEWTGILVAWFLLRQESQYQGFRRDLVLGLIATGTTIAGLGIYQHHVVFPQMAAEYGSKFDRLKTADPLEASRIRRELARDNIPVEGSAFQLFDQRLRESRVTYGLFALANTLGGFLAVCLMLATTSAIAYFRTNWSKTSISSSKGMSSSRYGTKETSTKTHPSSARQVAETGKQLTFKATSFRVITLSCPWICIIPTLCWCWLLTKSRTAWLGTAAGFAVLFLTTGCLKLSGRRLIAFGVTLAIVAAISIGVSQFGGLDHQVITEAPKSLLYRLQYWSATWQMISNHPWLGVGPGRFRTLYLIYKLPEASEAILDPHNLFLDVAANGGLLALVGLLMLCIGLTFRPAISVEQEIFTENHKNRNLSLGTFFGFIAISWSVLLVTRYDDRSIVLLPISLLLFLTLSYLPCVELKNRQFNRDLTLSAATALLVHLLGAGGIGMPAVILLLLSLIAMYSGSQFSSPRIPIRTFSKILGFLTAGGVLALYALFATAILPTINSQTNIQKGDTALRQDANSTKAAANYRAAAAADVHSAEPWRRLAELAFREAEADRFRSNDLFEKAVGIMREVRARDPANYHDDQRLGMWWSARWRVTHHLSDAQKAVLAYERAWIRYPTNAELTAELAFARDAAKDNLMASESAAAALKQDNINHQRGHRDRYLPDEIRSHLEELIKDSVKH